MHPVESPLIQRKYFFEIGDERLEALLGEVPLPLCVAAPSPRRVRLDPAAVACRSKFSVNAGFYRALRNRRRPAGPPQKKPASTGRALRRVLRTAGLCNRPAARQATEANPPPPPGSNDISACSIGVVCSAITGEPAKMLRCQADADCTQWQPPCSAIFIASLRASRPIAAVDPLRIHSRRRSAAV